MYVSKYHPVTGTPGNSAFLIDLLKSIDNCLPLTAFNPPQTLLRTFISSADVNFGVAANIAPNQVPIYLTFTNML